MTREEIEAAAHKYEAVPKSERKYALKRIADSCGATKCELVRAFYENGVMTKTQVSAYARHNPEYADILGSPLESTEDGGCAETQPRENLEPFFADERTDGSSTSARPVGMPEAVQRFVAGEMARLTDESKKLRDEIKAELKKNAKLVELSARRCRLAEEKALLSRFAERCAITFKGDFSVQ